ncbi:hypothetical protein ccbrp13_57320 [Ktedonobacteria bacterium brp13]|nr:hypothetical protein ccbrp13_57320 [Ktedonobacteria bacterium brp13]
MSKRHQQRPAKIHGHNNPEKTTEITTGPYKKKEAYVEQAKRHENPAPLPAHIKVHPQKVIPPDVTTKKQDSIAMMEEGKHRSGSDSNAYSPRKDRKLNAGPEKEPGSSAQSSQANEFEEDLRPNNFAGANYSLRSEPQDIGLRAANVNVKELHTRLADLTKDELRSIVIVPAGERLEQGAKYIDLQHLEQGEFVGMADMVAPEGHYYVPKHQTDYVLWNRLRQIDNPARLDESETPGQ